MRSRPISRADRYCVLCDKLFARPNELKRHMQYNLRHNPEARQFRCHLCNKPFTQRSNVAVHLRTIHKRPVVDPPSPDPQGDPPAKAKRGKRPARKNNQREASSSTNRDETSTSPTPSPGGTPSVSAESPPPGMTPAAHSTGAITPVDTPNFGEGSFPYDGPMDTSLSSLLSEFISMDFSNNSSSPGSLLSTPMTSPTLSLDQLAGMEAELMTDPLNLGPLSASPFPDIAPAPHLSFAPAMYGGVGGSLVPGQPGAYYGAGIPPLFPTFNNQVVLLIMDDILRQRDHLQNLYNCLGQLGVSQQVLYPQQQHYQYYQPQYHQQQQYGWPVGGNRQDQLSADCLAACNEAVQRSSLNLPGDISQLANDVPF